MMQLNSFGCGFLFANYHFDFFVADVKVVEAHRYLNTSAQSFLKIFANICFQVSPFATIKRNLSHGGIFQLQLEQQRCCDVLSFNAVFNGLAS